MKIKAISLYQPHASAVAYRPEHAEILAELGIDARKSIETRSSSTKHRGPVLICSTKNPVIKGLPNGVAVSKANIVDCRPLTEADADDAQCRLILGYYGIVLSDIEAIEPFDVSGQQGFFQVELTDQQAKALNLTAEGADTAERERKNE